MSRKTLVAYGATLVVGGLACWFFPLFHIRPNSEETGGEVASTRRNDSELVDSVNYVDAIFEEALGADDKGTDIAQLSNAFDDDMSKARSQYGRQAGLGGAWYFCVRGVGTVQSVEPNRVFLSTSNGSMRVCFELGPVVDNTIRESIGIEASEFANSRDFNAVSAELNRRVEREVIAPHQPHLRPGVVVEFVGCAKIGGKSDLAPLHLIPIKLLIHDNERDEAGSCAEAGEGASP